MTFRSSLHRVLVGALVLSVGGAPQLIAQTAAQSTQSPAQSSPGAASPDQGTTAPGANSQNPNDPRFSGARPDPSAGPQTPTLSPQVPESPNPIQQQDRSLPSEPAPQASPNATGQPAPPPVTQRENPVGTAAAEKGATRGGAASKPAGSAIAPAKQRQVRSLLIKLGLVAAAGVAVGTVMGLSKGSPTTPPGTSKTTSATR